MSKTLLNKICKIRELAESGLDKCDTNGEKNAWLSTFSNAYITAKELAENRQININTARKNLNSLIKKKLLFSPSSIQRNKRYINYDLLRILH